MTGLLQRLASRAAGTAWTVRSDARLPFASAPGAAEEPHVAGSVAAPMSATAPVARSATHVGHPAPTQTATLPTGPLQPVPGASAHRTPEPLLPTQAGRAAPAPVTAAAMRRDPMHGSPGAPRPLALSRHEPFTAATPHAEPAPQTASRADPAPLLAARATAPQRPAAPPTGLAPAQQAVPAAAVAAEPTEVHVHIGRIEVTALHQPAPRQRPARERTQPMSLDAYLSRKKAS